MADTLWAVVPVKRFDSAKARLTRILSDEERRALAEAMMRDVLSAASECPAIAGLTVVTCDGEAARIAEELGAEVVATDCDAGHSAAADAGIAALRGRAANVLVLSIDIPQVQPTDLAWLASVHGPSPAVTLVRAEADAGTNALIVSPPDIMDFHFGLASEARHIEAARRAGARVQSLSVPRMAFDLDRPDDLARFLEAPSPTRTFRLLTRIGARRRLACDAEPFPAEPACLVEGGRR